MFECKQCGNCCIDFGESGFLPLHPWEAEILKKLADEKGVILNIKPKGCFFDKKHNLAFFLQYGLYNNPCPFYINNLCSIYDNRPLVCKSFPLSRDPIMSLKYSPERGFFTNFADCKNHNPKDELKDFIVGNIVKWNANQLFPKLKESYGSNYFFCIKQTHVDYIINHYLGHLIKNKIIDPVKIKSLKKCEKYNPSYFLDFMVDINVLSKEKVDQIYTDLINFKQLDGIFNEKLI